MEKRTFEIKNPDGTTQEGVRITLYVIVPNATRELYGEVAADRGESLSGFLINAMHAGVQPAINAYEKDPEGVAKRRAERASKVTTKAASGAKLTPEERQKLKVQQAKEQAQAKMQAAHERAEALKAAAAQRHAEQLAALDRGELPEAKPRKQRVPKEGEPIQA